MSTATAPAADPITRLDDYRLLGRSGLRVSPLCLGTMTFGTDWGWGSDEATSRAIFDRYAEAGGNFIDTANFYTNGTSERMLGDFLQAERERFVVATKYTLNTQPGDPNAGGNHRKNMVQAVEASLKRLRLDAIDLYWLHIWDDTTPVEEVMRGFDDLVRAGKIHYAAVSDTPAWRVSQMNTLAELRGWSRFVATQISYSLIQRTPERDLIPMCEALDIAVLPWSPLSSGVLSGKYTREDMVAEQARIERGEARPFGDDQRVVGLTEKKLEIADAVKAVAEEIGRTPSQVALNWLMRKRGVTSIILGARTLAHLDDNLACLGYVLDDEQMKRLDDVSAIELGFPHDFRSNPQVRRFWSGGTSIEDRLH